jgi:arylsulfatase A-like enzyme
MLFKHPQKPDLFKRWLQAYMACVSFIDDQVGTVLDALDKSEFSDNTLIILTSDHGFHVGGKEALYKQTLWDSGTRIPFIVSGLKGIPEGIKCQQPISLIDVYPTLIDICGLPENPNRTRNGYPLDGHSLKPLLHNTPDQWSGPDVAITALPGKDHSQHREHIGTLYPHFSVRSKDWRYSLTSDGQEELYHYPSDPYEFHNLAKEAQHNETKIELKRKLVTMRDGDQWLPFEYQTLEAFEITCEVKGQSKLVFDQRVITDVDVVDWTPLRIRVAGKRSQVWLDNRVHSDKLSEQPFNKSSVQFTATESRQLRIRNLFPSRTQ